MSTTKMKQIDRKMTQVKALYFFIKENEGWSVPKIAEEFGVHKRTIERYLEILKYNELVHQPKRGKWYATEKKVKQGQGA